MLRGLIKILLTGQNVLQIFTELVTLFVYTRDVFFGWRVLRDPSLGTLQCCADRWQQISIRRCESHCLRRIDPDVKIAFIESDRINRHGMPSQAVASSSLSARPGISVLSLPCPSGSPARWRVAPASPMASQQITLISVT